MKKIVTYTGLSLTLIAIVIAILGFSESQIASIVNISAKNMDDSSLLLNKMSNIVRIYTIIIFVVFYLAIYFVVKAYSKPSNSNEPRNVFDNHQNTMSEILSLIKKDKNAENIIIWGLSLNWTSDITTFLDNNPRKNLDVKLFIPDKDFLENYFVSKETYNQRMEILRIRISKWERLFQQEKIKSIKCFNNPSFPYDMGLILNKSKGFFGYYNWVENNGKYNLAPIDKESRLRFLINDANKISEFIQSYQLLRFESITFMKQN